VDSESRESCTVSYHTCLIPVAPLVVVRQQRGIVSTSRMHNNIDNPRLDLPSGLC
jgi:hypothetical protein